MKLGTIAVVTFVIGIIGYQLGLDQLNEAPSEYLGLFVHSARYAFNSGSIIITILLIINVSTCLSQTRLVAIILHSVLSFALMVALSVLLVISVWKRHWFNAEPGQQNPYKTVYKVLNFTRKHAHPLQRSAFTYCEHNIPTRVDFAKRRYAGPFTNQSNHLC